MNGVWQRVVAPGALRPLARARAFSTRGAVRAAAPAEHTEPVAADASKAPSGPQVDAVPPVVAPPQTHGIHVATVHFTSHNKNVFDLDFFADFAVRAAHALNIPTGGIAALPTRTSLWTVPRGPFVHKKSQENFWRRTHHRCVKVYDANDAVVDRWLQFLRIHEMPGIASKALIFRRYPLGIGKQLQAGGEDPASTEMPGKSDQDVVREMAEELVRAQLGQQ